MLHASIGHGKVTDIEIGSDWLSRQGLARKPEAGYLAGLALLCGMSHSVANRRFFRFSSCVLLT